MYTIYADGVGFYSPYLSNEGYGVISPKLTLELNKAGSLTFLLPPNNVMYNNIKKLKTIITVFKDNEEVFRGRVLHDKKDFYNRKNVYCEGEMAFLNDSIKRPYTFKGSAETFFTEFINNHNSQVDADRQFTVGNIDVADLDDQTINTSNDEHSKTWDEMNDKLLKDLGGYFRIRNENQVRYIDYVSQYGSTSEQVIECGLNMLDLSEHITAENLITCLIPIGAELKNGKKLNIKSVNDNKDYLENEAAISLFGRIWGTYQWYDITSAKKLKAKGEKYLEENMAMSVSLNVKAIDLNLVDVDTERIKLGDQIRVVSIPHNLDAYFLCSKIVLDLVSADKTEFTLGVSFNAITDKQVNDIKRVNTYVNVVKKLANTAQDSADTAQSTADTVKQDFESFMEEDFKTLKERVDALELQSVEENE